MSEAFQIPESSISQIKKFLEIVLDDLAIAESQGLFLWGPPGIGKSSLVKQIARDKNLKLIDLRLPLLDPVDLRGLPMVDKEAGKAVWLPPDFLPDKNDPPGILFLDEINAAPPSVQASAYQLVLDRRIGEYKLPPGWIIIAAGNRTTDRSVAYRLPTALANRFTHMGVKVDYNEWTRWAWGNEIDPYIIAFLKFHPDLLMSFDPKSAALAFPTPRSWEFVSRLQKLRDNDTLLYLKTIKGTIGESAAQQLLAFLNYRNELPDPLKIINGEPCEIPQQIDAQYVLLGGLIQTLLQYHSENQVQNFFTYVAQYEESNFADHAIVLVREAMLAFLEKDKLAEITGTKSFANWMQRNRDVIS